LGFYFETKDSFAPQIILSPHQVKAIAFCSFLSFNQAFMELRVGV
jgi:hypothetical protein